MKDDILIYCVCGTLMYMVTAMACCQAYESNLYYEANTRLRQTTNPAGYIGPLAPKQVEP